MEINLKLYPFDDVTNCFIEILLCAFIFSKNRNNLCICQQEFTVFLKYCEFSLERLLAYFFFLSTTKEWCNLQICVIILKCWTNGWFQIVFFYTYLSLKIGLSRRFHIRFNDKLELIWCHSMYGNWRTRVKLTTF